MADKMAAKIVIFSSRWTRESPNTILYGLSRHAQPFLKLVLQSGHQNPNGCQNGPPKWPPKMAAKLLKFNVDGLEDHLPLCMGYQGLQNHS